MRSFTRGSARCACCCISWWLVFTALSHGGVVTDGSLGPAGAIGKVNNDFAIPHTLGTKVGGNLFHSFSELNLVVGESATFSGPGDAANVLARVTSGSPSSIDGTLRSTIPGANLFLMNPKGVVFGPNASLDVSGSFTVTTADYVKLADGGRFNSTLGSQDSLTSAPVTAFGFLSSAPAGVAFDRTNLVAQDGMGLSLIAGDITLTGATLTAPGGNLSLFSARGPGELPHTAGDPSAPFREAAFPAYGDILLKAGSTAKIDSARGGGKVGIRGGKLVVTESSTISSINQGGNAGGGVELTADTMSFLKGGRAEANAQGSGRGGSLSLRAGELLVDGDDGVRSSSIRSRAESGSGDAGSIAAEASHLILTDGGNINGTTRSAGRGADVSLMTESLLISGATAISSPGIFADASNGTGAGGNLDVEIAGALTLGAGGVISATTFSSGHGGNLTIHAGSMSLDGTATLEEFTGVFADAVDTGDAGSVMVSVDGALSIVGGAEISSSTISSGRGGNITINAGSMSLDGRATPETTTGIFANSDFIDFFDSGDAGNIAVNVVGTLSIVGNGRISSSTISNGRGGNITINAGSMSLDGRATPLQFTGIFAESQYLATGDAGNVTISVDQALRLVGGAVISSSTRSSGHGGNVSVRVSRLEIASGGHIDSDTLLGSGNAGSVSITAGTFSIDGKGGLHGFTGVSVASLLGGGNGGDVVIEAGNLKILNGGYITSDTYTKGKGGNISVASNTLSIDGGGLDDIFFTGISSNARVAGGPGGTVSVRANELRVFNGGISSDVLDSSGNGGDVVIQAGNLTIFNGGYITSDTSDIGKGGRVSVVAITLSIDGGGLDVFTGITSDSFNRGNGGDVVIEAGNLKILNGGQISSDAFDIGKGGTVLVTADSLLIDGAGRKTFTGISSTAMEDSSGNAGDVVVRIGDLKILNRGGISSATSDSGKGGSVSVTAGSLLIDGRGATGLTGISAQADRGSGNAGDVVVQAGDLKILNFGTITSGTSSSGNGGSVSVTANSLFIEGRGLDLFTGITAKAESRSTGNAGDVAVAAGDLVLRKNAGITAASATGAPSGSVRITAESVQLDSGSIVGSENTGSGDAGSVRIKVRGDARLENAAVITVAAVAGNAGQIDLESGTNITLLSGSRITASAGLNGGSISLQARDLLYLRDSSITATAGTARGTGTAAGGTGGNISIDPVFVVLDHSTISANAALGAGGNILLRAQNFLSSESPITATGTTAGTVTIAAPDLDLSGALADLAAQLVDTSTRLQERCVMRLGVEVSSFLAIGRGGAEASPEEVPAQIAARVRRTGIGKVRAR